MSINLTENELYQEIDICLKDGVKIGEAEVELCEECFDKYKQWLICENIEDRLERIADRLEKMVGDTDGISNKS